jgi:hypothetical protein
MRPTPLPYLRGAHPWRMLQQMETFYLGHIRCTYIFCYILCRCRKSGTTYVRTCYSLYKRAAYNVLIYSANARATRVECAAPLSIVQLFRTVRETLVLHARDIVRYCDAADPTVIQHAGKVGTGTWFMCKENTLDTCRVWDEGKVTLMFSNEL